MITSFTDNKFYILSGKGENWNDFDGPFDTAREAASHLAALCGEWASPEILHSTVVVHFKDNVLDLTKDDNGVPINGSRIYWKDAVWFDNEIIWEHDNG